MTEEFEKWFADEFGDQPARETKYWPSWNRSRDVARIAWQASRKQALEEAADLCDSSMEYGAEWLAKDIRALQQQ